jgi:hypothetical protein
MSLRALSLALVPLMLASAEAAACPLCDSETAARVRSIAFGPDFLWHVAATLAPAPALLGVLAAAAYAAPWLVRR